MRAITGECRSGDVESIDKNDLICFCLVKIYWMKRRRRSTPRGHFTNQVYCRQKCREKGTRALNLCRFQANPRSSLVWLYIWPSNKQQTNSFAFKRNKLVTKVKTNLTIVNLLLTRPSSWFSSLGKLANGTIPCSLNSLVGQLGN